MKRFFAFMLVGCMLLFSAPALAQQFTNAELTLDFHFGTRIGIYTGETSGGLPDGSGTFESADEEGVEWTYDGEWSDGHFEGYGATVWSDGWREEGLYSGDYLNGEGAEYRYGTVMRRGTYANGELVRGQVFDEIGNPYFEGDFEDGFRIESPAEQAVRLAAFFSEAADYDYDLIWDDYEQYIGQKFVFAGKVSYLWVDDTPAYQEFAIDVNNDPDEWIDVFGYMAKGEDRIAEGEENVMIYGVLLDKYRWEDDEGAHSAPLVQFVGVERLDFSCETLKVGSKGKGVKALQTRLKELGYYAGSIDGDYGKGTARSVADFQTASGLPADGAASLKTLYTLFAAQNLPEQPGETAGEEKSGSETPATREIAVLWTNNNPYTVENGAQAYYVYFALEDDSVVTELMTYHYLNTGARPGQLTLYAETGEEWGPFQAVGRDGQGGVKNAYWVADTGELELPTGRYAIVDSDPDTWSCNAQSGYYGIAEVRGYVRKAQTNPFAAAGASSPTAGEMSGD